MTTQAKVDWEIISRKEFRAYERVRASGVTNMWNVSLVGDLSGLDRDTIFAIMKHYSDLDTKYPGVNKRQSALARQGRNGGA